jgi:hypothetical protein
VSGAEKKAARKHLAVAVLYGQYKPVSVNSAVVSCASAMSASTVRAHASSGAIPPVVTERAARSAIFRACLTHPDTFQSDAGTAASDAQTLVFALLSTFVGSACMSLPYKLPAHQLDVVKDMQLMHVYSTCTQLFNDSSTGKHVRCRCTFALWHDAPKL